MTFGNRNLILALWAATIGLPAGAADRQKPPFPEVNLARFARSENAVQALGARLPAVAAWYGKTPGELAKLLRHDPNLWVNPRGRLLYACELESPLTAGADATSGTTHPQVTAAAFPLDQTFRLHSTPSSPKVIYLDFNGQTIAGTAWNASHFGGASFTAAPFDLDGSPATFGTTELERIQNIWRRVAEDYSLFDVDVTTEEPPADALTRTGTSDTFYGVRVMITPTNFYPNAGGVSYIGVFDDVGEYYKTSFAFSNALQNSEKYIGEACAHESGHAVGLHHEGKTDGTVYYEGQGSWAPIMGNSYYRNVTQWARGEYAGANNTEDQLQTMLNNGLSYYPDDHGNTAATATALPGTSSVSGSGFIERNTDVDVFRFLSGAGSISIGIAAAPLGPDLDVRAEIRDGSWNLVASANPPELGATLSANLTAAGTYYLVIANSGYGDPLTTGYSSYASLGQYTFTGTVADPGNLAPPVAVASASVTTGNAPLAVAFSSSGSTDAGGAITGYSWKFGDGSTSTDPSPSHTYVAAGTYAATLTVTDNDGLTGTTSVSISVRRDLRVQSIALAPQSTSTAVSARATVFIKEVSASANPVGGATVSGTWGGIVSGTSSGTTASDGSVVLSSPQSASSGTITFTVTGVSASGYTYDSTLNVVSSSSVSVGITQDPAGAPGSLQAVAGKAQVTLKWQDKSSAETGFSVERRPRGSGSFAVIGTVAAGVTSYTNSGLSKGSWYDYRVRASTAQGFTAYSNTASARVK